MPAQRTQLSCVQISPLTEYSTVTVHVDSVGIGCAAVMLAVTAVHSAFLPSSVTASLLSSSRISLVTGICWGCGSSSKLADAIATSSASTV